MHCIDAYGHGHVCQHGCMDCMSLLAANVVQVFVFGGGDVYVLLECAVVMCTCLWMPMGGILQHTVCAAGEKSPGGKK